MFNQSISAWGQVSFTEILCQELQASELISLVDLMQRGSMPLFESMQLNVLKAEQGGQQIHVKCGVFFDSVITGCQCSDDPEPIDSMPEYAEIALIIDMTDGSGRIVVE